MMIIFLSACSVFNPSASSIEIAIAQTKIAEPSQTNTQIILTETKVLTLTPTITISPTITNTPTPKPTKTPKPTVTPYVARWLDQVKNPLDKMKKETDKFTGYTWYSDKTSPKYRNVKRFFLSIGQKN